MSMWVIGVEFRVLGPVEVDDDGHSIGIGTPRDRTVLGILLTTPNQLVSVDQLVDELWPDRPPAGARSLVPGYVSRVRRALRQGTPEGVGAARLVTRRPGYLLRVEDQELDRGIFGRLLAEARAARRAQRLDQALARYRQAHQLWRGQPFADVSHTPAITAAATALTELHLTSLAEEYEIALAADQGPGLVAELTELCHAHPLHEPFAGLLMLALYRSGRQAAALEVYATVRARLVAEIGDEPGPDLQTLHQRVLRRDPALAGPVPSAPAPVGDAQVGDAPVDDAPVDQTAVERPAPATPARTEPTAGRSPAQLPPDLRAFAGRTEQLRSLDGLLPDPEAPPGPVVIAAVVGMAGVGKTALAVHWAHRVADRFPGGQLYLNLRGFDPGGQTMDPAEAIRDLLAALQVPPGQVPVGVEAQVGLYRSLVGRRPVLVVLDNARDSRQVRPLLPGAPGCMVVVTSRSRLAGLVAADGAVPLTVPPMSAAEARELWSRRLGPDRAAAEPRVVDEIVEQCGRLPLAVAIVAARAAFQPTLAVEALADQLRAARGGLAPFAGTDPATDLRGVLSWSYQTLRSATARLFRLVDLHPGPAIGPSAAASLSALPPEQAGELLAELVEVHLVTELAPGRYALHELVRAYAAELARASDSADERRAARRRAFDHYLHTASRAARVLEPLHEELGLAAPAAGVAPEPLSNRRQALAWFVTEYPVLQATMDQAARTGFDSHVWRIAWSLQPFFERYGYWRQWVPSQRAGLAAARRQADRAAQAGSHRFLAGAYARLGRYPEAHAQLRDALTLAGELGDRVGSAHALRLRAWTLGQEGRYREAILDARRAFGLLRSAGDRMWRAAILNAVGWYLAHLGSYQEALVNCQQALALQEESGDIDGVAATLDSLGYAHHHLGHHPEATACYQRALQLLQTIGDRHHEAVTLLHLGDTQAADGAPGAARASWQRALAVLDVLEHPDADQARARLDEDRATPGTPR